MRDFTDRIKLDSNQRKEVERYLGVIGILNEHSILKLVRKIKEIERRLNDLENTKKYSNIK